MDTAVQRYPVKDTPFSEAVVSALLAVREQYSKAGNLEQSRIEITQALVQHSASTQNFFLLCDEFLRHTSGPFTKKNIEVLEALVDDPVLRELLCYCGWWLEARFFQNLENRETETGLEPRLCYVRDTLADVRAFERHFDMYALAEAQVNPQKLARLDKFLEGQVVAGQLTVEQARNEREKSLFLEDEAPDGVKLFQFPNPSDPT